MCCGLSELALLSLSHSVCVCERPWADSTRCPVVCVLSVRVCVVCGGEWSERLLQAPSTRIRHTCRQGRRQGRTCTCSMHTHTHTYLTLPTLTPNTPSLPVTHIPDNPTPPPLYSLTTPLLSHYPSTLSLRRVKAINATLHILFSIPAIT